MHFMFKLPCIERRLDFYHHFALYNLVVAQDKINCTSFFPGANTKRGTFICNYIIFPDFVLTITLIYTKNEYQKIGLRALQELLDFSEVLMPSLMPRKKREA